MKTRPSIGNTEGIYGIVYTSDKDKSNAFNKFFSSIFIAEDPNTAPNFHIDKSDDDASLSSITIDPAIVFEKLSSLKNGKAPEMDGQLKFSRNVQISYAHLCPYCSLNH